MMSRSGLLVLAGITIASMIVRGQLASAQPGAGAAVPPPADGDSVADPGDPAEEPADLEALNARVAELESKLKTAAQSQRSRFPIKVSGHGDVGFFAAQGDGSGFRRDAGHEVFPERRDIAWVFYGDLLATQVNTRGDVADLGEVPGVDRFDSVDSQGNPTFLVNEVNLSVSAGLGETAMFTSSVNFMPRSGRDFSLGDSIDIDLAQLEWKPTEDGNTSIFVGKVDSLIGIEYKTRKPAQRFGITPSLLARYTTGTAVGIKARSKLLDEHLVVAASVTNGSFGTEQFHFYDEVDRNGFKTLSGRGAFRTALGSGNLEVGVSGQYGTQDGAPNGAGAMWFGGVDAELELGRVMVKAQWLKGRAPGEPISMAYRLDLKQGAYLETDVAVTPIIGVLGRAEFRDAEVQQGMERLYITKSWRATGGVRLTLSPHAIVKAEYCHNGEYGDVPGISNDVVTTSAVLAF